MSVLHIGFLHPLSLPEIVGGSSSETGVAHSEAGVRRTSGTANKLARATSRATPAGLTPSDRTRLPTTPVPTVAAIETRQRYPDQPDTAARKILPSEWRDWRRRTDAVE